MLTSTSSNSGDVNHSCAISSRCAEVRRAELLVLRHLEVRVRELAVLRELLLVGEVVAVAPHEVVARVLVDEHLAAGHGAERGPADERLDRPREVVVQRGERDVRRRVRVVDRVRDPVLHDRLARVELPAEERVDEPRDRDHLLAELRREEVVAYLVPVVHRPRRVEPHRHRLGADRERAHEDVEVLERGLQVHHPLARLVVARAELLRRARRARRRPTGRRRTAS